MSKVKSELHCGIFSNATGACTWPFLACLERREGLGVLDVDVLGVRVLPFTIATAPTSTTSTFTTSTGITSTSTTRWTLEMGVDLNILLLWLLGARLGATALRLLMERSQREVNFKERVD